MPGKAIGEVFELLEAGKVERAWRIFLENYDRCILQVVHVHENDPDRASDCFLFVCEKLCENHFHRLTRFDTGRGVRFRTWLNLVVAHLCIDWQRERFGRIRPPAAICRLPDYEQSVYQLHYEQALDLQATYQSLRARFPEKGREDIFIADSHIHEALKPRQRWQLSFQRRRTLPIRDEHPSNETAHCIDLKERSPGPESLAQSDQEHHALMAALSSLEHEQRFLLRLRYQEALPLREVARLAGLKDASQARHRINAALTALGVFLTALLPAA